MSTIDPLNVSQTTTPSKDATKPSTDAFGKDAFMKLLIEQMKHQSPTDPSDGQEWINQMTQFSMLEQLQQQTAAQAKSDAAGYLGRTVSYVTKSGQSGNGVVESIDLTDKDNPTLTVAGQEGVALDEVTKVS
jgi:flagellar basal-body rod modification protein FlgD